MEIQFHDGKLRAAIEQFLADNELDDLAAAPKEKVLFFFREGWSACMAANYMPAVEICLFFLRLVQATGGRLAESKLTLAPAVVRSLLDRAKDLVGEPEGISLAQIETVDIIEHESQRLAKIADLLETPGTLAEDEDLQKFDLSPEICTLVASRAARLLRAIACHEREI